MNYIIEIGCEEIPARFMPQLLENLKKTTEAAFTAYQIKPTITTTGTYRRLIIVVANLPKQTPEISTITDGPAAVHAVLPSGDWGPAAIGFAKKMNQPVENLIRRISNGREVIAISKTTPGQPISAIIPSAITHAIQSLHLPIAMRWGTGDVTFIRPIHWIMSLLETEIVPFEFGGITADRFTYGHRFLSNSNPILIESCNVFFSRLEENYVIADHHIRKLSIIYQAKAIDPTQLLDDELVDEVTFLTESPVALQGQFNPKYQVLPTEVLIECMRKNQKYFPILEGNQLSNRFIFVGDSVTEKSRAIIIAGNETVLQARLADSLYFWEQDTKTPISVWQDELTRINFQRDSGTIADKLNRLQPLARKCCDVLGLGMFFEDIMTTISWAKLDLASQMVREFPRLQGIMGKIYATHAGENEQIAWGIADHYYPRFSGDQLPTSETGIVMGISDRIDTLIVSFLNDLTPTGSQDPWGLRRTASGLIEIISKKQLEINVQDLIDVGLKDHLTKNPKSHSIKKATLIQFLNHRFSQLAEDNCHFRDHIAVVNRWALTNIPYANSWIATLDQYRSSHKPTFKGIVTTMVRVSRISEKAIGKTVDPSQFSEPAEKRLWQVLEPAIRQLSQHFWARETEPVLNLLAELVPEISQFFESVLINCPDIQIATNRQAMVGALASVVFPVLNFESIIFDSDV